MNNTMTRESSAKLLSKLYTLLGEMELYCQSGVGYGGMTVWFDDTTRELSVEINTEEHVIITLPAGVDVNLWIKDGRRNWRPLKRFAESILVPYFEQEFFRMFEEGMEFSISGDVYNLEELLESGEKMLPFAKDLLEPSFNREYAEKLAPNHPIFAHYDNLIAIVTAIVEADDFEARVEAENERVRIEEQRAYDEARQRYIDDPEFRKEADDWVSGGGNNPIFRRTDIFGDLREAFKNGWM